MSFTKRMFYVVRSVKEFSQNKSLQKSLVFFLGFFLFVGFLFNSYTATANYDIVGIYNEVDRVSTASTGVPGKHSHKAQGFQMSDFAGNTLDLLYPQGGANYSEIVADPEISTMAKLGLIGAIDVPLTALLYNPPYVDVTEHLAQQWIPNYDQTSGGVYAQSSLGYSQLMNSGIVDLWSLARNVAYMFFVVVFIVAGFMIMFRHKLGGQTMVTVYNSLPNIIVGLILVTFSFALVGLLIDVGAVLIRVLDGVLGVDGNVDPTKPAGVWITYSDSFLNYGLGAMNFVDALLATLTPIGLLQGLLGAFVLIILIVMVAFVSIKIFFTLVKAYVGILFDTIAAPIVFAVATIPGRQAVMKDWFNRVVKNVLVFVLVFFLVNLPLYFMRESMEFSLFGGDLGTGRQQATIVTVIIMWGVSIYILFLAANVPKMLDDYFPQTGGKGSAAATEGAKKDLSKIPLVGGFFKG